MRVRVGAICVLTLAMWGCEPPEMVQMTPPGIVYPHQVPETEAAEARGEVKHSLTAPNSPPKQPSGAAGAAAQPNSKDAVAPLLPTDPFKVPN